MKTHEDLLWKVGLIAKRSGGREINKNQNKRGEWFYNMKQGLLEQKFPKEARPVESLV